MKYQLLISVLLVLSHGVAGGSTDISGTWECSIDRPAEKGGPFNVTFVLKQVGEKLNGTFSGFGPIGKEKVTGTVKGDKVVFGWELKSVSDSKKTLPFQVAFDGVVQSPIKMTGAVGSPFCGAGCNWTAIKKKK